MRKSRSVSSWLMNKSGKVKMKIQLCLFLKGTEVDGRLRSVKYYFVYYFEWENVLLICSIFIEYNFRKLINSEFLEVLRMCWLRIWAKLWVNIQSANKCFVFMTIFSRKFQVELQFFVQHFLNQNLHNSVQVDNFLEYPWILAIK